MILDLVTVYTMEHMECGTSEVHIDSNINIFYQTD